MRIGRLGVVWMVVVLLMGCQARISVYSPRRTDTEAHRKATNAAACVECHDVAEIERHGAGDECLRCHVLCSGC